MRPKLSKLNALEKLIVSFIALGILFWIGVGYMFYIGLSNK